MKKINTDAIEKMAKEKNIDKDKIQEIADGYKGKSENELMDELVKIGKNLQGKEEVVSKLKNFLDEDQRKKIDAIMGKISEAEIQSKKTKSKKSTPTKNADPEVENKPTKKTKKVVKKVKKSSLKEDNK